MTSNKELKNIAAFLPLSPGVYIFKDKEGKILYIGKAKSLKKRVQSYFSRELNSKTQVMVSKIAGLEHRLTPSEAQAQILEAALIKKHQPQYNIDLKDDKSFPWIRITNEEFPVVSIYRRKGKRNDDLAKYFGPYTNVKLLRQAIKVMRRVFGFRSCKKMPACRTGRPDVSCLYYRLQLCPGPCIKKISVGDYQQIIEGIGLFLESRYEELIGSLSRNMHEVSREKRYEEAAKIRDQINALSAISESGDGFSIRDELEGLKRVLKLERLPLYIEAFDISNISGQQASGSMVTFFKGVPNKNNYRKFRIRTVSGIDDYKMLGEVVRRRYSRLVREKAPLPDLIIIDGGKGHLVSAEKEVRSLGLAISLISIAKEREHIYASGAAEPLEFKSDVPALNLIRRIRDEAHRFAVSYHHILRRKNIIGK